MNIPLKETTYRIGFWLLAIFLAGYLTGQYFAQSWIIEPRLKEAVRIGAVVIDQTVYDLNKRVGK